jgi:hypothetical protein
MKFVIICLLLVAGYVTFIQPDDSGFDKITEKYASLIGLGNDDDGNAVPVQETVFSSHEGTYEDPAGTDEIITFSSPVTSYDVWVDEIIRGDEAGNVIEEGSEFNDAPPEGYEFLLVHVNVKYARGDNSIVLSIRDFKALCEGTECNYSYAVLPDRIEKFSKGDVMSDSFKTISNRGELSNGIKTGWVPYIVPQDETVLIEFNPEELDSGECYINVGS